MFRKGVIWVEKHERFGWRLRDDARWLKSHRERLRSVIWVCTILWLCNASVILDKEDESASSIDGCLQPRGKLLRCGKRWGYPFHGKSAVCSDVIWHRILLVIDFLCDTASVCITRFCGSVYNFIFPCKDYKSCFAPERLGMLVNNAFW